MMNVIIENLLTFDFFYCRACGLAFGLPCSWRFPVFRGRAQDAATEDFRETVDDRVVVDTEMAVAAEKFFDQEIVKELHVDGCEADRRINPFGESAPPLQFRELSSELFTQPGRQAFKHPAKVTVLKFEHVYVHQEPEVVMLADHLADGASETFQRLRLERFLYAAEKSLQALVNHRLIFGDDGFEDVFLGAIVIIKISERCLRARGYVAHRVRMKALPDKKLFRRTLNTVPIGLDGIFAELGH